MYWVSLFDATLGCLHPSPNRCAHNHRRAYPTNGPRTCQDPRNVRSCAPYLMRESHL